MKSRFTQALQHYQHRRPRNQPEFVVDSSFEDSGTNKLTLRRHDPAGTVTLRFPINEGYIQVSGSSEGTNGKYRIKAVEVSKADERIELSFERSDGEQCTLDTLVERILTSFMFTQQVQIDAMKVRSSASPTKHSSK